LPQNNGSHSQQIIQYCVEYRLMQKLWHNFKQIHTQAMNICWFFATKD